MREGAYDRAQTRCDYLRGRSEIRFLHPVNLSDRNEYEEHAETVHTLARI